MSGYRVMSGYGLPEDHIVRAKFCREFHYLLNRQGLEYHALFTDPADDEHIDPVSGVPRPTPVDPADRSKYLAVNEIMRVDYPVRIVASRYSGKMREVVGCALARGERPPFGYAYDRTHGIVWSGSIYWLVEVSPLGVYATKLKAGDDCCNSFSVRHLMPSESEVKKTPGWQEYRDKLSLWWYRHNRGGSVVQQLIGEDGIAAAHQNGVPWCADHGWAFSASGAEAQAVVASTSTSPVPCYVAARYKLAFEIVGTGFITAAFTTLESGLKYTLQRNNTVWEPLVPGVWSGAVGPTGNEVENPFEPLPSQNAPVHVFYAGEAAQVTRWLLTFADATESDTRPAQIFQPAAQLPWPTGCYAGYNGRKFIPSVSINSGSLIAAHKSINSGFTGPGFAYTGESSSFTKTFVTGHRGNRQSFGPGEGHNFFTLNPQCYFYYINPDEPDDPPVEITQCSQAHLGTTDMEDFWTQQDTTSEGKGHIASVVLFMEEREAILAASNSSASSVGSGSTSHGNAGVVHETIVKVATSHDGQCPGYEWDIEMADIGAGDALTDHASTYSINTVSASPSAMLALGAVQLHVALTVTPGFNEIDDYNFQTFLECGPAKEFAESAVFAMRGNVNHLNLAYWIGAGIQVDGDFIYASGEVMGFVGKV